MPGKATWSLVSDNGLILRTGNLKACECRCKTTMQNACRPRWSVKITVKNRRCISTRWQQWFCQLPASEIMSDLRELLPWLRQLSAPRLAAYKLVGLCCSCCQTSGLCANCLLSPAKRLVALCCSCHQTSGTMSMFFLLPDKGTKC